MELQNYLRQSGLDALSNNYYLKVNRHQLYPNLVCLKYSQLDSPMDQKIVQQARGIILDQDQDWSIISYPFDKFFNYGEINAAKIDWETARVYEKLDGSLMVLYYYDNQWLVQSSGTADASGLVNHFNITFAQLFWKVWAKLGYILPQETHYCFMFELMTPYNRIVVHHQTDSLVLHGVRNIRNLKESDPQNWSNKYNWTIVKDYPLTTLNQIIAAVQKLNPIESEGYIVCDRHFNRIKLKSPQYVAISHLKDKLSTRRLLEIVLTNEGAEFLTYYPEWGKLYYQLKTKYDNLVKEIELVYHHHQHIPTQKDFAIAIKHLPYSGVLFALRNKKTNSIHQALQNYSISSLEQLLGLDTIELFPPRPIED